MSTPGFAIAAPTIDASLLDPQQHLPGLRYFIRHFALPTSLPTLEVLQKIIAAFAQLPYENLSKIIKFSHHPDDGQARLRMPAEVMEDHLRYRTGGTCFSLTFFLQGLLLQQAFANYVVMGDMKSGPNVHCALIVILEGLKYLVDPGYLLRQPMPLDPARRLLFHSAHHGVELVFDAPAQSYDLFTFTAAQRKWRYRFADRPVSSTEFLEHWQASFHRNSMHGLCLTQVHDNELIFVLKDFMRVTSAAGKRNFNLKRNLHGTIQEVFGIAPAYVEQALAALRENMARERRDALAVANKLVLK